MRKYIFTTVLLFVGILTANCSNITRWSQDPFAGKGNPIKNGEEKPSIPIGPKPIVSDALRIRAPDYVSFKELRLDKFNIVGQVLLKDYTFELMLENLSDFPGATFDAATGDVSWMPQKGAAGSDLSMERTLRVKIFAQKPNEPVLMNEKEIKIGVARTFEAPEVVSVQKRADSVREGGHISIEIAVRDADATSMDKTTWPKLQFTGVQDQKNVANYVYVSGVELDANGQYVFTAYFDLENVEITQSAENVSFAVRAVSRFNLASPDQRVDVKVFTKLSDAISTWTDYVNVTAGEVLEQQFIIADPKGEGLLALKTFMSLPTDAVAKCSQTSNRKVLACNLTWATPASSSGTYVGYAGVEMKNADSSDSTIKTQDIPMRMRVLPAPTTTTLPPPETTTTTLRAVVR